MAFHSSFSLVLNISRFFGLIPVSVQKNSSRNQLYFLWSLMQIALLVILLVVVMTSEGIFIPHNYIGEFNEIIKLLSIYVTHLVILVEGLVSRYHLGQFLRKIRHVDALCSENFQSAEQNTPAQFEKSFSRKWWLNVVAILLVEFIIIANVQADPIWSRLWYLGIISLTVTRLRHLHLMMNVDAMSFRLRVLRLELEAIVECQLSEGKTKDREHHAKLCLMKKLYNTMYECCSHVNFTFGFSQLFNLMQNFVQLTCDLYWIYSILYRNDLSYMLVLVLLLIPTFQVVIVTLSSCENCLKEVRSIAFLLHHVDTEDETLVENFSLQIIHEPFNVSVTGFFNMDFTLLKAMVAAITTYMVIFIQFMPKEDQTGTAMATTTATTHPTTLKTPAVEAENTTLPFWQGNETALEEIF